MKKLDKKVDDLLDQILDCDYTRMDGLAKARILLRRALKEQDRDTRHACAGAMQNCPSDSIENGISEDDAYAACINAKGFK